MVSKHNKKYIRGQPFVSPTFTVSPFFLPLAFRQHFTFTNLYNNHHRHFIRINTHTQAHTSEGLHGTPCTTLDLSMTLEGLDGLVFSVLIYSTHNVLHQHQHLAVSFPWNNREHCQK